MSGIGRKLTRAFAGQPQFCSSETIFVSYCDYIISVYTCIPVEMPVLVGEVGDCDLRRGSLLSMLLAPVVVAVHEDHVRWEYTHKAAVNSSR